jgi:Enoyl-CoA hydratase/isomerase
MSAVPKSQKPLVLREDRDDICTLTMNRPQQLNLLTTEMLAALQRAFDSLKSDTKTRVVILAGSGKGFCAGHDLREIRALKELPKIEALVGQCSRMMQTIPVLPQPARRAVRPSGRRRGGEIRHEWRDLGLFLLDAGRRGRPEPAPKARAGDASHR